MLQMGWFNSLMVFVLYQIPPLRTLAFAYSYVMGRFKKHFTKHIRNIFFRINLPAIQSDGIWRKALFKRWHPEDLVLRLKSWWEFEEWDRSSMDDHHCQTQDISPAFGALMLTLHVGRRDGPPIRPAWNTPTLGATLLCTKRTEHFFSAFNTFHSNTFKTSVLPWTL